MIRFPLKILLNFFVSQKIISERRTEYLFAGSIFMDAYNNASFYNYNTIIYGHNMRDGSMFAALHDYLDKETWEYNPLIFFDNLYEYHCYKIFAVFTTTASIGEGFTYHQMVDAESEEDFNEFIATCKDLAVYETGETPVYGDKVICLSTCEYTQENGRLVVAAYRIS
jgi:sortase B